MALQQKATAEFRLNRVGEYCIHFIHYMSEFNNLESFLRKFSKNTRLNDKKTSISYCHLFEYLKLKTLNSNNTRTRGNSIDTGIDYQICISKNSLITL